jgi:hypothetical protein
MNLFNIPPGITMEEYAKALVSIISYDYLGGQGSDTILLEFILDVFRGHKAPRFADLARLIEIEIEERLKRGGKLGGRSGLWKETVMRQKKFMSIGCMGNVVDSNKHIPIESLFGRHLVLELGNMKSPQDRAFVCHFLLNQLLLHLHHKGIVTDELRLVIVMEEFHNLVSLNGHRNDQYLDLIDILFREIRKYGVGLIAIDQTPSEIPNAIFANMNTKVTFTLNTDRDVTSMARAMNMQLDLFPYLGMLQTGQAIVSVKQRVAEPFLMRVPYSKELSFVSDSELQPMMQRFSDLAEPINPLVGICKGSNSSQDHPNTPPTLSPMERVFLDDLMKNPFDGVDKRTKKLGLHSMDMTSLHKRLADRAVIKPVAIDGKKLFDITPHGRDMMTEAGLKLPKQNTKGGLLHSYGVHLTLTHLRKLGFNPKTEVGNIDIVDEQEGIAIEVETGKSNVYANISKLNNANHKYKYMLCTDKEAELTIRQLTHLMHGIHLKTVRIFCKLNKDKVLDATVQKTLT